MFLTNKQTSSLQIERFFSVRCKRNSGEELRSALVHIRRSSLLLRQVHHRAMKKYARLTVCLMNMFAHNNSHLVGNAEESGAQRAGDSLLQQARLATIPPGALATTARAPPTAVSATTQRWVVEPAAPRHTTLRTTRAVGEWPVRTGRRTWRACCEMAACRRWWRACGPKWCENHS